jgi:hypothetical protein
MIPQQNEKTVTCNGKPFTVVNGRDVYDVDDELLFTMPIGVDPKYYFSYINVWHKAYELGRTVGRTELQSELKRLIG